MFVVLEKAINPHENAITSFFTFFSPKNSCDMIDCAENEGGRGWSDCQSRNENVKLVKKNSPDIFLSWRQKNLKTFPEITSKKTPSQLLKNKRQ